MFYLAVLTYILLYLTVIFLWLPRYKKISVWWLTATLCVVCGLLSGKIDWLGAFFLIIFAIIVFLFAQRDIYDCKKRLLALLVLFFGAGLLTHTLLGFHNVKIINNIQVSNDAIPFSMYLNIDKTFVGIVILGFTHHLIASRAQWLPMLKNCIPYALAIIVVTLFFSYTLGFIKFDPKFPRDIVIWSVANLLSVCLAEEAFFRGFIQKNLAISFKKIKFGGLLSIVMVSILFGLAHYHGGWKYVALATVAGMGYGWVYHRTKQIEASIFVHFLLNLVHILFFSYPMLA